MGKIIARQPEMRTPTSDESIMFGGYRKARQFTMRAPWIFTIFLVIARHLFGPHPPR